ncbi:MAG: hypothetical protein IJY22_00715 [Clostridia bacterium]|nr:hypothetical protein [Clostridia bacterium]
MYSIESGAKSSSRLVTAFGAGALCALILPKAFFCILGMGLLLGTAYVLSKH